MPPIRAIGAPARITVGALTRLYAGWPIERAFDGIAQSGIGLVGLWEGPRDAPLFPRRPGLSRVLRIRRLLDRHGLAVSLLTHRLDIGKAADLHEKVRIASDLGIASLGIVPVPPLPGEGDDADELAWLVRTLSDAAAIGAIRGVTVVVKPHGGITGSGRMLAKIVELVASPGVGVWYDPGNVRHYVGVPPEEDVRDIARNVVAVCAKDYRGGMGTGSFPTPGDGDVDFVSIFRTLCASGFTGDCFVELVGTSESPERVDRELVRARVYLERAVAEALHS